MRLRSVPRSSRWNRLGALVRADMGRAVGGSPGCACSIGDTEITETASELRSWPHQRRHFALRLRYPVIVPASNSARPHTLAYARADRENDPSHDDCGLRPSRTELLASMSDGRATNKNGPSSSADESEVSRVALTEVSPVARRRTDDRHIRSLPSTHFMNRLSHKTAC